MGKVTGFEDKTGRYLVDFNETVSSVGSAERSQFALHPVNLEVFPSEAKPATKDELR